MQSFFKFILLFLFNCRIISISNVCINIHQYEIYTPNTETAIKNSNHFCSFPYNFILKSDIY